MSTDSSSNEQRADLRDYLRIISRRRWTVLLTVVIVVGMTIGYSLLKTPVYSATASVLIPEQQAGSALNVSNSPVPQAQTEQRVLADEQNFAQGDAVKRVAAKALGDTAHVSVVSSTIADLLTFTASSTQKTQAAVIANAYANAYITARRSNQVSQYTQQVTALQASIVNLQQQAAALPPGSPQSNALTQAMQTLNSSVQQAQAAAQLSTQYGPSLVKAAVVPSAPSSPKPVRNGLLGAGAGLIVGIALAFLFERLDDGITSRTSAEEASGGLPVVAILPTVSSWSATDSTHLALVEDPTSPVAEAYRTLRTSIQFLGLEEPKKVIGVTSSIPGEGKTTTTANLAVSFAKAGSRVVVISGDLRRPHIHDFFGLPNSSGLTSVLMGEPLELAVSAAPTEENVWILPSGPVPPNPAEILSLDRVRELVDSLAGRYDMVLIDCPPVLPVSDALLLSRLVDGMLVIASIGITSKQQLTRTYELLRQVHTPLLGTILNRVPERGASSYGYEYGYYSTDYRPIAPTVDQTVIFVPGESTASSTEATDAPATEYIGLDSDRRSPDFVDGKGEMRNPHIPSPRTGPLPSAWEGSSNRHLHTDSPVVRLTAAQADDLTMRTNRLPDRSLREVSSEHPKSTDSGL